MAIEQLFMSLTALVLCVAAIGTTTWAGPSHFEIRREKFRDDVGPPQASIMVDCKIERVEIKDSKIIVTVKDEEQTFEVAPSVQVTKDDKAVELMALARGDYAVLHLAAPGSKIVTRIQAVSSR